MEIFTTILTSIFICIMFGIVCFVWRDLLFYKLSNRDRYRAQVLELKRRFFESGEAFKMRLMKQWRNRFHY